MSIYGSFQSAYTGAQVTFGRATPVDREPGVDPNLHWTGIVRDVFSPHQIQVETMIAPQQGDLMIIHRSRYNQDFYADYEGELLAGARYQRVEIPVGISDAIDVLRYYTVPQTRVDVALPPDIEVDIGDAILLGGRELPVAEIRYVVQSGQLTLKQVTAGTPELTLKALMRRAGIMQQVRFQA